MFRRIENSLKINWNNEFPSDFNKNSLSTKNRVTLKNSHCQGQYKKSVDNLFILYGLALLFFVSLVASISNFICQMISILYKINDLIYNPVKLLFQIYGLVIGYIAVITELDLNKNINDSLFLQFWAIRGIFLIYVGLFVIEVYLNVFSEGSILHLSVLVTGSTLCSAGSIFLLIVRNFISLCISIIHIAFRT